MMGYIFSEKHRAGLSAEKTQNVARSKRWPKLRKLEAVPGSVKWCSCQQVHKYLSDNVVGQRPARGQPRLEGRDRTRQGRRKKMLFKKWEILV